VRKSKIAAPPPLGGGVLGKVLLHGGDRRKETKNWGGGVGGKANPLRRKAIPLIRTRGGNQKGKPKGFGGMKISVAEGGAEKRRQHESKRNLAEQQRVRRRGSIKKKGGTGEKSWRKKLIKGTKRSKRKRQGGVYPTTRPKRFLK